MSGSTLHLLFCAEPAVVAACQAARAADEPVVLLDGAAAAATNLAGQLPAPLHVLAAPDQPLPAAVSGITSAGLAALLIATARSVSWSD